MEEIKKSITFGPEGVEGLLEYNKALTDDLKDYYTATQDLLRTYGSVEDSIGYDGTEIEEIIKRMISLLEGETDAIKDLGQYCKDEASRLASILYNGGVSKKR